MNDEMKMKLAKQLTKAMFDLGAPIELLCIVGSLGDTQSDEDVLDSLEQYNERGTCMHEIVSHPFKWMPDPEFKGRACNE